MGRVKQLKMPVFRNYKEETRPIISLGRRSDPYILCSDSEDDAEEIEFEKAVFERQCLYEPSRTRKHFIVKKLLFCLLIVLFVAILVSVFYYYFSRQTLQRWKRIQREELMVRIDGGYVNGELEDEVFVFKGIPYASPPLHHRRWHYPEYCTLNSCWNGTFKATQYGEKCIQAKFDIKGSIVKYVGNEDCLFINVWSPTTSYADKKLPVLVYIHGGGLVSSSGNEAGLHPTPELVKEMDVVGVSFNYRLNAFGFLALDVLSANSQYNTSGNYGFMDQIMALKWVQNNIEKFGGDRNKVTLLGQGSGGTSVLVLMTSPLAKGLFHQAIAMSPSSDVMTTTSKASKDNMVFLNNTKCHDKGDAVLQCLYELPPREIINAIPWNVYPYWGMSDCYDLPTKGMHDGGIAVVDGHVLPHYPVTSILSNSVNELPLIIGNTAQEIGLNPQKDFTHSSFEELKNYTREKLMPFFKGNKDKVDKVFDLYNFKSQKESCQLLYLTVASDIREVCPVEYLALTASVHFKTKPVYRYIVTHTLPRHVTIPTLPQDNYTGLQYSFHMLDLIALFGFPTPYNYKPSNAKDGFMHSLRTEFKHFIHYGVVRNLNWTSHNVHNKKTAIFTDNGLEIIPSIYHGKECKFWLSNGFVKYAWIN